MRQAAPLFATPAAPIPVGGAASWFEGAGEARLRAALFPAPGRARGSVIVSPGRTEPIEKYFETVERLRERGFAVLVHDWRGQGLSERVLADRRLGHARGWREFVTDFEALLAAFAADLPRPWFALAHSMGGCFALLALATGETRFAGAILSAPMFGFRTGRVPPPLAGLLASLLSFAGRAGAPVEGPQDVATPFEANVVTHDPHRYARNEEQLALWPDLGLGPPTFGWVDAALSARVFLLRNASVTRIATPVTIVAAGEDLVVTNPEQRAVAARLAQSRYLEIPGAYHEILQETDALQAPFWRVFAEMVEPHAP